MVIFVISLLLFFSKYVGYQAEDFLPFVQLNTGQAGGKPGLDLNVVEAWAQGYTGKGVTVAIMDDGLDYLHPDLAPNYVSMMEQSRLTTSLSRRFHSKIVLMGSKSVENYA